MDYKPSTMNRKMKSIIKIDPQKPLKEEIDFVSKEIKRGKIVLFPTDTVYGLCANGQNQEAIQTIYQIKKREQSQPLILFLSEQGQLRKYVDSLFPWGRKLVNKLWPGAVTFLFKAKQDLQLTSATKDGKIGIRIPTTPFLLRLINALDVPLLTTSANFSGEPAPVQPFAFSPPAHGAGDNL